MKNNLEFKIENGKMYSREIPKDVRVSKGECAFCEIPVYVSSGQLLKYFNGKPTHKSCRKQHKMR